MVSYKAIYTKNVQLMPKNGKLIDIISLTD